MSRFYAIRVTDPKTGDILIPLPNGNVGFGRVKFDINVWTFVSMYGGGNPNKTGSNNPNALRVEFDVRNSFMDTPINDSWIKVWGPSLAQLAQGSDLTNLNIVLWGGMSKGLPLAMPQQIGIIASGQIRSAWGTWQGLNQCLEIFIQAGGSSPSSNQVTGDVVTSNTLPVPTTNEKPANLVFQWQAGQPLMDALTPTLTTAYPQYAIQGAVSDSLVWTGMTTTAVFGKLSQLAEYVRRASENMLGGYAPDKSKYMGVRMLLDNNAITVIDGTKTTKAKAIAFTDLIGMPAYADDPNVIAMAVVLRGDIRVGSYVTIPTVPVTMNANAALPGMQAAGTLNTLGGSGAGIVPLSGSYMVTEIRHVGDSRNPDGAAWATVLFLLVPQKAKQTSLASYEYLFKPGANKYGFRLPM